MTAHEDSIEESLPWYAVWTRSRHEQVVCEQLARKGAHVLANVKASDAGRLSADLLRKLRHHRWDRTPTAWSH